MTENIRNAPDQTDAQLVAQTRAGNRDAFGCIVARYQSLICSLAYSATGDLSRSEDLAQDTFITAWKQLRHLQQPERLRPWLCGIARNLINNSFRRQAREPVCAAEPLETVPQLDSGGILPADHAISREEEALLWRSLERIPELYREPLILFYREHQSVQAVADHLELTPDAVKQRLARGRRMLQEEVMAFIEGALEGTAPGKAFTVGVLVALPIVGASTATAATAASAAAKVTAAAKGLGAVAIAGALLGPLIGLLGAFYGARASIRNTRSGRERQFMLQQTWVFVAYVLVFLVAMLTLTFGVRQWIARSPVLLGTAIGVLSAAYVIGLLMLINRVNRRQRQIRVEDGTADWQAPAQPLSRGKQIWNAYGGIGGGTFGALAWMIIQAAQMHQWTTAAVTVIFGTIVVLVGGRMALRNSANGVRVMIHTLTALGLYTIAAGVVHWRDWIAIKTGQGASASQAVLLGSAMVAAAIVIAVRIWLKHRRVQ